MPSHSTALRPHDRRVVLVSCHYLESARKAGFHFLADAFWRLGYHVVFVTAPVSRLSRLRRDERLAHPLLREANRLKTVRDRLASFVLYTRYHPANLRVSVLNAITSRLFSRYANARLGELEPEVERADLVVFESTSALLFFERFHALNGHARFVYRVSDYLPLLDVHPVVQRVESSIASRFDLISTPTRYIAQRFAGLDNVEIHGHCIDKHLFDLEWPSPYEDNTFNAVFVGTDHLDRHFLAVACDQHPDWIFHVIGPFDAQRRRPNLVFHGELPFAETVPYIAHADLGLHILTYRPGVESRADSLKVIQYTYCGLPIVAPSFLSSDRRNLYLYEPDNATSVTTALGAASKMSKSRDLKEGISSWDELAAVLAGQPDLACRDGAGTSQHFVAEPGAARLGQP